MTARRRCGIGAAVAIIVEASARAALRRSKVSAPIEPIIGPRPWPESFFTIWTAAFHPGAAPAAESLRSGGRPEAIIAFHHGPAWFPGAKAAKAAAVSVSRSKPASAKEAIARRRAAAEAGATHLAIVVHATKITREFTATFFGTKRTESAREGFAAPHAAPLESAATAFTEPAIAPEFFPPTGHPGPSHFFKASCRLFTEATHRTLLRPAPHSHAGTRLAVLLLDQFSMNCHEQCVETS